MSTIGSYLEDLVRDTHKSETEVMAEALQTGLRQLWRERVLGRYLRGEMPREQAIEAVGADLVNLADRQHQAAGEDLRWGWSEDSSLSSTPDR